jgi:hypothetical protein
MRSMPRCYSQDKWVIVLVSRWVTELLQFSYCELLLLEAVNWGWGPFGNPEEEEYPLLEAVTKQQLVKIVTDWEDLACPTVICEVQ